MIDHAPRHKGAALSSQFRTRLIHTQRVERIYCVIEAGVFKAKLSICCIAAWISVVLEA